VTVATVPSWVAGAIVSVLAFVGAWAALRVTVARLKDDVAALTAELRAELAARQKDRLEEAAAKATLQATLQALGTGQLQLGQEISRVRKFGHQTRNRCQDVFTKVSERVARLEAVSKEEDSES
jgi:hypothetical protein